MLSNIFYLLSDVSTKVNLGGTTGSETAVKVVENTQKSQNAGLFGGSSPIAIIIYCILIFAVMYFITVRPRKKEEEKMEAERNTLKVGDWIVLNNGMYGIIVEICSNVFVCEFGTNRAVRIPVLKSQVIKAMEPNLSNRIVQEPEEDESQKKGQRLEKAHT